jgi:FkbM family methyltransferase
MLIEQQRVLNILKAFKINVNGVLHVGAHHCEEKDFYNNILNINDENIIWVDANPELVEYNHNNGRKNVYAAALDDDVRTVKFNITNNGQSSSLLKLGIHKQFYPGIDVVKRITVTTEKLSSFFNRIEKDPSKYNFWNFDIQGSEYNVLKGSQELLQYPDIIYTEVNVADVYVGCGKLNELDELLAKYNFRRVDTIMTGAQWGDAIYVKIKPVITSKST